MLQATRALNNVTFQRFHMPESKVFLGRRGRVKQHLERSLLQPHLEFARINQRRDWEAILDGIIALDLEGITRISDFDKIMNEIDCKAPGQILDNAFAILREMHEEIRKEELPVDFSLVGFIKKEPTKPTEEESRIATPNNFDPLEILIRTFGIVDNIINMGKKYNLPEKYWAELEDRFAKGYTFLRAAKILSQKA